jgi:hypothetical protein
VKKNIKILLVIALLIVLAMNVAIISAQGPTSLPGSNWWTSISLQNPAAAGSAQFTMVAKEAIPATGSFDASGCSVGAGASVIYNPGLAPNIGTGGPRIGFAADCGTAGTDNLPSGFRGGVTVSSDATLVAVVSVGNNPVGSVGVAGGTASAFYQGISQSKTGQALNFPIAKNNFGGNQTTTFYIQAVADAAVTLTYSDGSTDGPHAIPAGQIRVFSPADAVGDAFFGAATATSTTGAIAGTVIEHPHVEDPATFALATRAFAPSDADTTLFAPIIKNDFFGGTTALVVQAVGGDAAVIVDFSVTNNEGAAVCTNSSSAEVAIPDGTSAVFGGPNDRNMPAGFGNGCFGSATIRSSTGQIVGAINEAKTSGKKAVYAAFPQSAATTTIAVPLTKEEFFNGRTAVVVQAVGDSAQTTTISAAYVNPDNCTTATACVITVVNGSNAGDTPTSGGGAVNFRRLTEFSAQYSGTVANSGTNNAVVISSDNLPIVAIVQETGFGANSALDDKNYPGFNQ